MSTGNWLFRWGSFLLIAVVVSTVVAMLPISMPTHDGTTADSLKVVSAGLAGSGGHRRGGELEFGSLRRSDTPERHRFDSPSWRFLIQWRSQSECKWTSDERKHDCNVSMERLQPKTAHELRVLGHIGDLVFGPSIDAPSKREITL